MNDGIFFIVIIIIGYVLIPWSKSNTEHFEVKVITDPTKVQGGEAITLFDYILESRIFSIDFENRITELKKVLESGGVLKKEDFEWLAINWFKANLVIVIIIDKEIIERNRSEVFLELMSRDVAFFPSLFEIF